MSTRFYAHTSAHVGYIFILALSLMAREVFIWYHVIGRFRVSTRMRLTSGWARREPLRWHVTHAAWWWEGHTPWRRTCNVRRWERERHVWWPSSHIWWSSSHRWWERRHTARHWWHTVRGEGRHIWRHVRRCRTSAVVLIYIRDSTYGRQVVLPA